MQRISIIVAAVFWALVACGDPAPTPAGGAAEQSATPAPASSYGPEHYEGIWELHEGHGPEGPVAIVPGFEVTAHIRDGALAGSSGCNSYGWRVKISGTTIELGAGGANQAGCAKKAVDVEPRFFAAMMGVTGIAREGDELVLSGPETRLVFHEVQPPPIEDIVGVEWQLEELTTELGAESVPAHPATLMLRADGTFEGSTGTRGLRGTWIEEADTVAITEMHAEGDVIEDLREQDTHVVGVIGDGFMAEVDGRTLTLSDLRGEWGLVYRAKHP